MRPDSLTLSTEEQIGVKLIGGNWDILCSLRNLLVSLIIEVIEIRGWTYDPKLGNRVIISGIDLIWQCSRNNRPEDIRGVHDRH